MNRLERVQVQRFGKFFDQEFALSQFTLFFGQNESGKTTLFDAFLSVLVAPSGNTRWGKHLKSRYGEAAHVKSYPEILPAERLSEAEFFAVHAVRSGDLSVLEGDDATLRVLSARLLERGLDYERLLRQAERGADRRLTLKHNREIQEIENRVATSERIQRELEIELKQLEDRRKVLLRESDEMKSEEGELESERRKLRDREEYQEWLALKDCFELPSENDLLSRLKSLEALRLEFEALLQKRVRVDSELDREEIRRNLAQRQLEEQPHLKTAEDLKKIESQRDDLLARKSRYHELVTEPPKRDRWNVRVGRFAISVSAVLVSVAIGFVLDHYSWGVISGVLAIGLVVWLRPLIRRIEVDHAAFEIAKRSILGEIPSEGDLLRRAEQCLAEIESIRDRSKDRDRNESDLREARLQIERLRDLKQDLEYQMRALSEHAQVRDLGALSELIREAATLLERKRAAARIVRAEPDRERFGELSRKFSGVEAPSAASSTLRSDLDLKIRKFHERSVRVREEIAQNRARLTPVLVRLERLNRDLSVDRSKLADLIQVRRAAGKLAEVFRTLVQDEADTLRRLGEHLGSDFGLTARWGATSWDELEVKDLGGVFRNLRDLSRATQDRVFLAFRLMLLRASSGRLPVLILDEPWAHMDRSRCRELNRALIEAATHMGAQVIGFTKDTEVVRDFREYASENLVVHELGVSAK